MHLKRPRRLAAQETQDQMASLTQVHRSTCVDKHHRQPEVPSILPETPPTLEEAVRLIGKLGGHLGRKHDGMPGVKTLWRGMQRLKDILQALSIIYQVPLLSLDMGNV
ncbi:MAG: hypothetical protein BWY92_00918 [Firmicutes bacterium ADurb.BinA052]|nr:MAG: hypothetical protein BWY92_00918 [Firmicutes bacterium ADurb.BinA052]